MSPHSPCTTGQYPIPIKKEKADDLHGLVGEYVPPEYRPFYAEIPTTEDDASFEDMDLKKTHVHYTLMHTHDIVICVGVCSIAS